MDTQHTLISNMRSITISREYGSGGGEIAARLAQRLGWQLIDHEVVVRVAKELGVSEEEAEASDERTESLVSRILTSLPAVHPTMPVVLPGVSQADAQSYHEALQRVIEGAVATGHVVIVGRGAQAFLADRRDVLHVRIVASDAARTNYVMQREGLDQAAASSRIRLKDRDRIRYLQSAHNVNPADAHLYDIVLNTDILPLDSVVDLITLALERKASRLAISTGELGPVVGLSRYPEQPGDFRPPDGMNKDQ